VNGDPRHVSYRVSPGEEITLHLRRESGATPADIPVPDRPSVSDHGLIAYMDEDLLILRKPAPMATLPGRHGQEDSLREHLADTLGVPRDMPYHPVNRLDKGTSGLLCIARHSHAQFVLTRDLHTGRFIREYLAVTDGIPNPPSAVLSLPIGREGSGIRRAIRPDGKPAITEYTLLYAEPASGRALVRLVLETGRTHQIRVHLSAIGCPVTGDYLYGTEHPALPGRFALHSALLRCYQPVTGRLLEIRDPLPDQLAALFQNPEAAIRSIPAKS
ncbi:MAG: RluA family pseudouridine synthase, partial [Clostridia bacterium]|nr:RluA family pseudouridine synthase [Clostridia bacterium]